jgi:hypothetical protein
MLNPTSFSHDHSISYNDGCKGTEAMGSLAPRTEFSAYSAETVSFDIIIDGTGAVPPASLFGSTDDVTTQIDDLKNLVYRYDGDNHEPNVVNLAWGQFTFTGRLTNLKVQYTLFDSDGNALRAKVNLSFKSYMTSDEELKQAARSSPDLTHIIDVKAGDTLPLLCYRIYKDSGYYLKVARFNNLTDFRQLKPGMRLQFPPLA